jgi:signal transduction histidine kinase
MDFPVRWHGRQVGIIRLDEVWPASDPTVAVALNAAAVAIEALRLKAVAAHQATEIAASRQRLVTAALEERRRIERNLHDGAQQMLFSVLTIIDDAEHHLVDRRDPGAAGVNLRRAHDRLSAAIGELRRLTRGLYPATLAHHGLAAAVEELCASSPIPATARVQAADWPTPVAATAYFVIAECLTNAFRHSAATTVTVAVDDNDGVAQVVVIDNGTGQIRHDAAGGLQHLHDRVAAFGGELHAHGTPATGSRVIARLPLTTGADTR